MTRHLRYLALLAAIALTIAACSSGGDSPFATASDGDVSSGDISSGDISSGDVEDLLDELPDTVGDLPGVSGECEALLNLFLSVGNVFLGGEAPPFDTGVLSGLPGDVRDDAQYIADELANFGDAVRDMGIDFGDPASLATLTAEQQEQLSALTEAFDSDRFNEAADNLQDYGEQECDQFG